MKKNEVPVVVKWKQENGRDETQVRVSFLFSDVLSFFPIDLLSMFPIQQRQEGEEDRKKTYVKFLL